MTNVNRVIVVGGGFGGLHVVRGLRSAAVEIVLIDRHNYHLFQPLLYQVASAVLSPADIAQPIRRMFRKQKNVQVVLGEVTRLDVWQQRVHTDGGVFPYTYLVLAAGATHSYFGHPGWEQFAPGLKTIDDALDIRRRLLLAYERAEMETDPEQRDSQLTFVVVGGGPTGVELAGAIKEIAVDTIPADFRNIDTKTTRVVLFEGQDRLLPGMSAASSANALRHLKQLGVETRLNTLVTEIDSRGLVAGGSRLDAGNVLWAAGVAASPLARSLNTELDSSGRVRVAADCSVPNHPEVFVIGDMAAQVDAATGEPVPGVAQGAMQMGDFVAARLREEVAGKPRDSQAFTYHDKGNMATIGRARAVADLGKRSYSGFSAWVLWSLVHVMFLIGFRNKLVVMLSWAWNYLFFSKGARLITNDGSGDRDGRSASSPSPPNDAGSAEG